MWAALGKKYRRKFANMLSSMAEVVDRVEWFPDGQGIKSFYHEYSQQPL